jgi:hypothetical protein
LLTTLSHLDRRCFSPSLRTTSAEHTKQADSSDSTCIPQSKHSSKTATATRKQTERHSSHSICYLPYESIRQSALRSYATYLLAHQQQLRPTNSTDDPSVRSLISPCFRLKRSPRPRSPTSLCISSESSVLSSRSLSELRLWLPPAVMIH